MRPAAGGIEPPQPRAVLSITPRRHMVPVSPGCHRLRGRPLRSRPKCPRLPTAVSQVCLWLPPCASVLQCCGQGCGNRTHVLPVPNRARYQTSPSPEKK